jgi:hypothetical protein
MDKDPTSINPDPVIPELLYAYTGKITGIGSAEIVIFDENGNEFYDC